MKRLLFSIIFKQNVKKINKISRINKKNFVYYCELENNCYAIKIYRNRYNAVSRYNNELFWLSQFQEKKFFGVPKIYLSRKIIFWNILVIDWIDGVSIKQQIDYEYFCMGDINNDLAGIFYSASTSLINNDNEIGLKSLYKIISNNKHFKLHNFIFFLIQRLVLADYFAGKSIKDFERIRYHRIIIELYFEKHIR